MDDLAWLHGWLASMTETFGVDVDLRGLDRMRLAGYNVLRWDMNMPLPGSCGKFNIIVAGEVLEHVHASLVFLQSCRDALTPTGRILLSTPNPCGVLSVLGYWLIGRESWGTGHVAWHSPRTLKTLAELAGLKIVRVRHCDWDTPEWWMRLARPLESIPRLRPTILYDMEHL